MFRTYPESEIPIPASLVTRGERAWFWVELPLRITYFMTTVLVKDGGHVFERSLLYSDIDSVLRVLGTTNPAYRLERVDVLIPPFLHGGTGYNLSQIKEVWESEDELRAKSFVLADGKKILDVHYEAKHVARSKFRLIASF